MFELFKNSCKIKEKKWGRGMEINKKPSYYDGSEAQSILPIDKKSYKEWVIKPKSNGKGGMKYPYFPYFK